MRGSFAVEVGAVVDFLHFLDLRYSVGYFGEEHDEAVLCSGDAGDRVGQCCILVFGFLKLTVVARGAYRCYAHGA